MTSVLFVDDEPQILEGLRDMLRRKRDVWEMTFLVGGEQALSEVETRSFDVVIADMRMPRIDGATLLQEVRVRHPETVRMILSGQGDNDSSLRAATIAHQFIAKPCSADELISTIERVLAIQTLLRDERVRSAAGATTSLPPAPQLYSQLRDAIAAPGSSARTIAAIVENDPAMCAKLLQLVNSAFFGLGRAINSPSEAVAYLGLGVIQSLALSSEIFSRFKAGTFAGAIAEEVEAHSLRVARLASRVSPSEARANVFIAGILHDIGKLVLAANCAATFRGVWEESRARHVRLNVVERERGAVEHPHVGAYLLGIWGLPQSIVEAVATHHEPPQTEIFPAAGVTWSLWRANEHVARRPQRKRLRAGAAL